jgi:transcriptional regulator with XRE-family HTH domain
MKLGNRIRQIREAMKMSQSDIANKCNISPQAYGQIERRANNSSYDTLLKVANALDVTITFMLHVESTIFTEKNKL